MLKGDNIFLRPLILPDAEELLLLQNKNRSFFSNYSTTRSANYWSLEAQQALIEKREQNKQKDIEYYFGIYDNNAHKLIGTISLFQVVRGDIQSAFIGYFLDQEQNGKGFATESVKLIVNYAFNTLHLHRIEAGVKPHNIGSMRVLEKAGFHKEGISVKNVKINGIWEDHQMLAIINPND
ncbi:alanine acetyltransferase [Paenibacillus sp. FSL R7-0273]|uniref:GNAT family N-acetyltransferase n=1 Tax=Paenibacillus sp. FSL R7-0273 TaxID=1536772 RepID=UPI0004F68991|nr:GNAT family protein [Paenibacillus sp. FSL R7-0273]AIQ47711.1 alanine acetyltransferase [Paenibacillus sp. FSL R7-0273]OMF95731.1 alanine acetyltransferase [Paenibacillus sp. FSL R7-0273]